MLLRIPVVFPTPSLCFWCTLHFPLTKSQSLAAGSHSPAQLMPGFIDPNEESDINPCCVFLAFWILIVFYHSNVCHSSSWLQINHIFYRYDLEFLFSPKYWPAQVWGQRLRVWPKKKKKKSYSSLPLKLIKQGPVAVGCQPFHVSLHPAHSS